MPIKHGGNVASDSRSAEGATFGRNNTGLSVASTPRSVNAFLARSIPRVAMRVVGLLIPMASVEMRGCAFHRGTWLSNPPNARHTRDGGSPCHSLAVHEAQSRTPALVVPACAFGAGCGLGFLQTDSHHCAAVQRRSLHGALCVESTSTLSSAMSLNSMAMANVAEKLRPIESPPRTVFCSTRRCYDSFGGSAQGITPDTTDSSASLQIPQNLACGVAAGQAGDAAAGMGARAAQVEAG